MLQTVLSIIHIILAIVLILVVLLQNGKQAGLSGTIGGGAETFFGKNKSRTLNGMFEKATAVVAVLFVALSLALYIIS